MRDTGSDVNASGYTEGTSTLVGTGVKSVPEVDTITAVCREAVPAPLAPAVTGELNETNRTARGFTAPQPLYTTARTKSMTAFTRAPFRACDCLRSRLRTSRRPATPKTANRRASPVACRGQPPCHNLCFELGKGGLAGRAGRRIGYQGTRLVGRTCLVHKTPAGKLAAAVIIQLPLVRRTTVLQIHFDHHLSCLVTFWWTYYF